MKKRIIFISVLFLLVLGAFSTAYADTAYVDCSDNQREYGALVSMLNKTKPGALTAALYERVAVLCRTDGRAIAFDRWKPQYALSGPDNCWTLIFNDRNSAETAAEEISQLPGIIYAECDSEVEACAAGTASFRSWGAQKMNFEPFISFCAREIRSEKVLVAVVDSGVYMHNDLVSRIPELGYDYVDSDSDPTNDGFNHGTAVAGIIADSTQNLPAYLLPIRILDSSGRGKVSDLLNATREAISKKADIINISLSSKTHSKAIDDTINEALSAGVLVVAAAGNDKLEVSNVCPGHMEESGLIVVGSVESNGALSSYTNYGDNIDAYAYGSSIQSCSNSGGYISATGTSFSAPHITALAAAIKLMHPEAAPQEVESRIRAAAGADNVLPIPDASLMIPTYTGLSIKQLKMNPGESIALPMAAYPVSCCEELSYSSSDNSVATVSDGKLIALKNGTAVIKAGGLGLENMSFTVTVGSFPGSIIKIPAGTVRIESGAFADCAGIRFIELPSAVETIGLDAFPDAVLLCKDGSRGAEYARLSGIQYIIVA